MAIQNIILIKSSSKYFYFSQLPFYLFDKYERSLFPFITNLNETTLNGYYRMLQKTSADFYNILNRYLTWVMNADKLLEIVMTKKKISL